MSAAPAYSFYPERAPERVPRERIRVVPGHGPRTQTPTVPENVVFLAKAVAVVLVVVTLVCCARLGLSAAAVSTSVQSQHIASQIDEARANGASLEVTQSTLSNPTRVKKAASDLKMAAPESVGTIDLATDVVATDNDGNLSLSKSASLAAHAGA